MNVVVFGAGSLGSLLGGLLAHEQEVTLVGRDPHMQTVREEGLTLTGAVEQTVYPAAQTTVPETAELAIVTVKSYDTATAAARLGDCDLDIALSLQNGMGNEQRLESALSCPVLAGTATYGALFESPGKVRCTGIGTVTLGPRAGGTSSESERVGQVFTESGIETIIADDMPSRLWEKLAVNAGINATTALARVDNGALVDGPAGSTARAAAREVARVAAESGVDLTEQAAVEAVENVAATTAANTSSMQQDVLAERRTEVDAINGYVVEQASQPVSVNETLAALLRAWEKARDLRED